MILLAQNSSTAQSQYMHRSFFRTGSELKAGAGVTQCMPLPPRPTRMRRAVGRWTVGKGQRRALSVWCRWRNSGRWGQGYVWSRKSWMSTCAVSAEALLTNHLVRWWVHTQRLSSQALSHITAKPLHTPRLILCSQHTTACQKCGSQLPQHLYAMLSVTPKQSQANACVTEWDFVHSSVEAAQNGTQYHTLPQGQALNRCYRIHK